MTWELWSSLAPTVPIDATNANHVPLTVSIGVAGYPDDADRREDLLNKADWAMYLAKRRGRDQVASFGDG
jgi:diguanylate cyclase (GGDEF)-like protein